ncbi:MAG TPA: queuosine salvage family protein [bacterium]|nr:queuosine salvage family protein [bacterium]
MNNFSGKEEIIRSLRPVVSDFKFVAVNDKVLDEFCSRIRPKHIPHPDWNAPVIYGGLDETGIDYFLVMNSINFCFWGDPKWTVEYRGRSYDGAFGMFAALTRALEEGHPIYDGAYLAKLSKTDLAHILRGNVPIPLLEPRLGILRDIGRGLAGRWGGRFSRMVAEVGGSAVALVGLLTEQFPSFNDSVPWGEGRLIFHKRAQLAPAMINERWRGKGIGAFRHRPPHRLGRLQAPAGAAPHRDFGVCPLPGAAHRRKPPYSRQLQGRDRDPCGHDHGRGDDAGENSPDHPLHHQPGRGPVPLAGGADQDRQRKALP